MDADAARLKKENLIRNLKKLPSLLVAFSGGVDSSFLLSVAHEVLGEGLLAATASSIAYPSSEQEEAIEFTRKMGVPHIIFKSDETSIPEFVSNAPDRCYHCKKSLCLALIKIAKEKDIEYIAHAANLDDLDDYRPGIKAAEEMGIISPLVDVKMNKKEIRFLSKEMGLENWNKPAMACLASRIPYNSAITVEKLKMVEESENFLWQNGFRQCRVRHHGSVARIEVEEPEIARITEKAFREKLLKRFREIGFTHVSVDLEGYVSGSMNRELEDSGAL